MKVYVVLCDNYGPGDDYSTSFVLEVTSSLDVAMASIAKHATENKHEIVQVSDVRKAIEQEHSFDCTIKYTEHTEDIYVYTLTEWEV